MLFTKNHGIHSALFGVLALLAVDAQAVTPSSTFYQKMELLKARIAARNVQTINLSWSMPATRVGGAPLAAADLAGYDLSYMGRSTGKTGVVHISAPSQTSYTMSGLPTDTYDFAVAAYDQKGVASPLSNVVTVAVK